jgi:hypothetical protein
VETDSESAEDAESVNTSSGSVGCGDVGSDNGQRTDEGLDAKDRVSVVYANFRVDPKLESSFVFGEMQMPGPVCLESVRHTSRLATTQYTPR